MGTTVPVTGGCLCGGVRYQAAAEPHSSIYCHCSLCRRATGQPRAAGVYFRLEEITFTKGKARRFRSSDYAERGFCDRCGTPLFYHSTMPELTDWICFMLGTLDEPERYPPTDHWNIETALPYALPEDGLPRHRQADNPYHWVRESLND